MKVLNYCLNWWIDIQHNTSPCKPKMHNKNIYCIYQWIILWADVLFYYFNVLHKTCKVYVCVYCTDCYNMLQYKTSLLDLFMGKKIHSIFTAWSRSNKRPSLPEDLKSISCHFPLCSFSCVSAFSIFSVFLHSSPNVIFFTVPQNRKAIVKYFFRSFTTLNWPIMWFHWAYKSEDNLGKNDEWKLLGAKCGNCIEMWV